MIGICGQVSINEHQPQRSESIFNRVGTGSLDESLETGLIPGQGTYYCLGCGEQLSIRETEPLPPCPRCGRARFRRDSIFTARRDHTASTVEVPLPREVQHPHWVEATRASLIRNGSYLVFRDEDERTHVVPIERGWTRIGRSGTADLLLDDPSVSRRHAMIVCEPGKLPHVLDDRSLNGVLVNGRLTEWGPLHDGDEIAIGRFRLYLLRI